MGSSVVKSRPEDGKRIMAARGCVGLLAVATLLGTVALHADCAETRVQNNMKVQYEWRTMDFVWPSARAREAALRSGTYNPSIMFPFSLEVAGDRVFLSMGSFGPGVPATLATVPKESEVQSPLLTPYPSWEAHYSGPTRRGSVDCSRTLVNVVRARADTCGRLWVADCGRYAYVNTLTRRALCPPKLVVFDLSTDQIIRTYVFPRDETSWLTLFTSTEVDTYRGCDDAFAYMSDSVNYRLHVYSWRNESSWTIRHPAFVPSLNALIFNVGGLRLPLPDGLYDLTISPPEAPAPATGKGSVFWHTLVSYTQNSVPNSVLQDPSLSQDTSQYRQVGERSPALGQQVMNAVDSRGIMFFSLANLDGVGCWNTTQKYSPETTALVSSGAASVLYPGGLRVELRQDGDDEVWLLSTARLRTILYFLYRVDTSKINVRIYRQFAKTLSRATVCEVASSGR